MTTTKPSYLGLLNAIAVGEAEAEPLFNTWANTTSDEALARTLRCVGMREGEHAKAFAKRMLELGFEVRWPERPGPEPQRLEVAGSTECSDVTKFETLGIGMGQSETDVFDTMFGDKTLDPVTGGLLGRYIAEERDSVRILAADYERLKAVEVAAAARPAPSTATKIEVKKVDAKKPETKKADTKKAVSKKAESKKAESKKAGRK